MEFIKLNEELVCMNNLFNVSKNEKERIIKLSYFIEGKVIGYELDYSDVKDDVNEEKTVLQKDYEKIEKLLLKEVDPEYTKMEQKLKDLEFTYKMQKDLKNKYLEKLTDIKFVLKSNKLNKIKRIKEIINNENK